MKKQALIVSAVALAASFGMAGCDLDTQNLNEPDRERALATPADVESLIGSAYAEYFDATHNSSGAGMMLIVTADHNTASWGNFGMRNLGEEPRREFGNSPAATEHPNSDYTWSNLYDAVSAASDGLRALEAGLEIGPGGERNPRARAFAKFAQGLALGALGLFYDQGFIVDETTDPLQPPDPVPYPQMVEAGLSRLAEAAQIASSNQFTLEPDWIQTTEEGMSSERFTRLIHSYMARIRANMGRTQEERSAADWNSVMADADAGITQDLVIDANDGPNGPWESDIKTYIGSFDGWQRADYHWVGQADVSGGYQNWLNTPVVDRQPFDLTTPDQRLPQTNATGERGLYIGYTSNTLLPPGRGTYHLSFYRDLRWAEYANGNGQDFRGVHPEMIVTEMRLYKAEGLLETGQAAAAADIVNETRVGNGGLPPVTPAGTSGSSCVPRKRLDPSGTCGDLRDALEWEFYLEVDQVAGGLDWWFTRGHGELVPGTILHLPIPGAELEVLQRDIYTYGGAENAGEPGTAGQPDLGVVGGYGPEIVLPGPDMTLRETLERVSYALEALELEREQNALLEFTQKR